MSSSSGILIDAFETVNDHFTSLEPLGTHGHNVLVRAKRFGRWYCLKALAPEEADQTAYHEMLVKEFEIMMRLQHSGVVQAYSLESVDALGECIVMEWVDGITLKEWLEGETTREQRRQVAQQLMDALAHIHSHGVAHRDIKPNNVMVTSTGMAVKIIDFGLADTDQHAVLKQPAGTLSYMAPEQALASAPDVRNDIYSLGKVLSLMDLGRAFKAPITRCLKPIEERYQSVEELQTDLRRRAARRRMAAIAATVLTVLALITAAIVITNRLDRSTLNATSERVDSLHNQLERTTTVIDQSLRMQDSLVKRLAALNDSLATLNNANATMRDEQRERQARQQVVEHTISEGQRIIDAANAATHLKHHLDTVTQGNYIWMDWNHQRLAGRRALQGYMQQIRNRYDPQELAIIEYSLTEYCVNYENAMRHAFDEVWARNRFKKVPPL